MPDKTWLGGEMHKSVLKMAEDAREGRTSRREFLATATALGVTSSAALAMIGVAPVALADGHKKMGGTLNVSMIIKDVRDPRLFDWGEMGNVARHFVEPLVRWNTDFTFSPRLLAGWEANDDASVYTLKLRDGVMWSNGDMMTAEHVAFNIRRWTEETEGNSMRARVGTLNADGVEIVDANTIRLNLSQPDITIIPGMSDYPALIVHPDFGGDLKANPIGTGPYSLEEFEVEVGARLVKRPAGSWYGDAVWGEVYLDEIVYTDYGNDPAPEIAAFEAGEVDLNYQTAASQVELMDDLGFARNEVATGATIIARGNQDIAPFDNANFRRALALAVSNEDMLELGQAGLGATAENHHVGPMHEEYADLGEKPMRNVDAAKALLEAEGLVGAEITYSYLAGGDFREDTSVAMINQFREAGLNVIADGRPSSDFWGNWINYPFSTTNWNGRPLGVQILNLAYRSGVDWNEAHYNNPDFDALLDQANGLADPDARREVMVKLQKMMQDDGVIIQPYWRGIFSHATDRVMGYQMHQAFEHHYETVSLA